MSFAPNSIFHLKGSQEMFSLSRKTKRFMHVSALQMYSYTWKPSILCMVLYFLDELPVLLARYFGIFEIWWGQGSFFRLSIFIAQ